MARVVVTGDADLSATAGAPPTSSNTNNGRALYREPGQPRKPQHMMYDRRVVRGNTYAAPVIPSAMAAEMERTAKEDENRARRKGNDTRRSLLGAVRASTPEPVAGRSHAELQTETFLEVISDRAPEFEMGVQTDALLDRPPTPLFVPKPSGVDAVTQIEHGDLFDFDYEVAPVLDVLVGKTLEAALMEVLQEDELAAIRARQREYEAVRNAELAEVQRLEGEVKRKAAERARRVDQERARVAREADVQRKVAAAAFARAFLRTVHGSALAHLREAGFFYDPRRREIETAVLAPLYTALAGHSALRQTALAVADDLIAAAVARGGTHYIAHREQQQRAQAARDEAAAAAARAAAEAAAAAAAALPVPAPEGDGAGAEGDDDGGGAE